MYESIFMLATLILVIVQTIRIIKLKNDIKRFERVLKQAKTHTYYETDKLEDPLNEIYKSLNKNIY